MTESLSADSVERKITSLVENNEFTKLSILFEHYGEQFYQTKDEIVNIISEGLLEHIHELILGPKFLKASMATKTTLISGFTSLMFFSNQVNSDNDIGRHIISLMETSQIFLLEGEELEVDSDEEAIEESDEEVDPDVQAETLGLVVSKLFGCLRALLSTMSKGDKLNLVCRQLMHALYHLLEHHNYEVVYATAKVIALIYEIYLYEDDDDPYYALHCQHSPNGPFYFYGNLIKLCDEFKHRTQIKFTGKQRYDLEFLLILMETTIWTYSWRPSREIILHSFFRSSKSKKLTMRPFKVKFLNSVVKIDTWSLCAKYDQLNICYPNGKLLAVGDSGCINQILKKPYHGGVYHRCKEMLKRKFRREMIHECRWKVIL